MENPKRKPSGYRYMPCWYGILGAENKKDIMTAADIGEMRKGEQKYEPESCCTECRKNEL